MVTILRFHPDRPPELASAFDPAAWPPAEGDSVWIDLEGPDTEELALLEDPFRFHPLAIEDCLTPEHQPKIEDFDAYLFLIFRGIDFGANGAQEFQTLKLAAFLGPSWVVTYHRAPMRSVRTVREKYTHGDTAGLAARGMDHLLYEILDHMIEYYFPVIEAIEEEIDAIEEELFRDPGDDVLDRILTAKRKTVEIKRAIAPHRDVFGRISRNEFPEVDAQTAVFYRDLYDSTFRLTEIADSYRDLLNGLFDGYLSVTSQRLNEVMKILTIFATIMLPLTFIAGVYGMNFEYMPELGWRYGYFVVWGVMLTVAIGMLWFFRRRGWL
ncbi:MAG: magnesium/cobalt transporter CorA [Gemmatimonadetes bacterium]|nr:magnesium/cobalt transporter CorA [Gemmatimonadota bacterium]